jgi:hypothetical protein
VIIEIFFIETTAEDEETGRWIDCFFNCKKNNCLIHFQLLNLLCKSINDCCLLGKRNVATFAVLNDYEISRFTFPDMLEMDLPMMNPMLSFGQEQAMPPELSYW